MSRAATTQVTSASASSTRIVVLSMIVWICFGLFCWYYPRLLISRDTDYRNITPPYQIAGMKAPQTVIVDFDLNKPLIDPPTVSQFLLRSTSIWWPLLFYILHAWFDADLLQHRQNGEKEKEETSASKGQSSQQSLPQLNLQSLLIFIFSNNTSVRLLQKVYHVATVVSAFVTAIGMSEGSTVMIKKWVQRRRPNFYALCGFDAITKKCTGDPSKIQEASLSFPSGHSSLAACGMTFMVLYLHGAYGSVNHISSWNKSNGSQNFYSNVEAIAIELVRPLSLFVKTCVPIGWALYVATSRLVDDWHHPSDVIMGLGLGLVSAIIAYHHWYPPIWSEHRGIPKSLLRTTTKTNANALNGIDALIEEDAGTMTTAPTSSNSTIMYNLQRRQVETGSEDLKASVPSAPSSLNFRGISVPSAAGSHSSNKHKV